MYANQIFVGSTLKDQWGFSVSDHLQVSRQLYDHHGIYVGGGRVVHYSGPDGGKQNATVRLDDLDAFSLGAQVNVVEHAAGLDPKIVVQRAVSRIGESRYSMVRNNCEHFANWAKEGESKSPQVRGVLLALGAVAFLTFGVSVMCAAASKA